MMRMKSELPDTMTAAELAGRVGVSKNRLYAMVAAGKIPADLILRGFEQRGAGRRYKFSRVRVMEWLSGNGSAK